MLPAFARTEDDLALLTRHCKKAGISPDRVRVRLDTSAKMRIPCHLFHYVGLFPSCIVVLDITIDGKKVWSLYD